MINASLSERSQPVPTLGDCAEQAITKLMRKIDRYKVDVLQDQDPEALHKMRVGMRRLRSILQVLEPVLVLPKAGTPRAISKLASVLGAVRDLDIMQATLQAVSEQHIPDRERHLLAKVAVVLTHRRQQAFAKMKVCFAHDYLAWLNDCQQWLKHPQYCNQYIAHQTAREILPNLLSPTLAVFFLHDGWFITQETVQESPTILHDLRKCTKRLRYQLEHFLPDLNHDATSFLPVLEANQELLGQMQDGEVFHTFLRLAIGKKNTKKLPVVSELVARKNIQAWHDWQLIKTQIENPAWRRSLRLACI